jgi:starch synthase
LGILNGIDYNQFNPANDCQLSANYAIKNIAKRVTNKLALQDKAGFPINAVIPLLSLVASLVNQKEIDILAAALDSLFDEADVCPTL